MMRTVEDIINSNLAAITREIQRMKEDGLVFFHEGSPEMKPGWCWTEAGQNWGTQHEILPGATPKRAAAVRLGLLRC